MSMGVCENCGAPSRAGVPLCLSCIQEDGIPDFVGEYYDGEPHDEE